MKQFYNILIRTVISASLMERETFVDKVSQLIADKMNADPDNSRLAVENIANLLDALKDELFMQQLVNGPKGCDNDKLAATLSQLNDTLTEINRTLQNERTDR